MLQQVLRWIEFVVVTIINATRFTCVTRLRGEFDAGAASGTDSEMSLRLFTMISDPKKLAVV